MVIRRAYEIQTIVEVILECDHIQYHDNYTEVIIDLTNMATQMIDESGSAHLTEIREMIADYLTAR